MDSHLTVIFVVISVLKHSYPLGVRIQASIEHYMLWDTNRAYIELISNCFCYYEYLLCRDHGRAIVRLQRAGLGAATLS